MELDYKVPSKNIKLLFIKIVSHNYPASKIFTVVAKINPATHFYVSRQFYREQRHRKYPEAIRRNTANRWWIKVLSFYAGEPGYRNMDQNKHNKWKIPRTKDSTGIKHLTYIFSVKITTFSKSFITLYLCGSTVV